MNRALLRLSLACLAMFVLLLINMNYVQAFEASSLAGKPRQRPGSSTSSSSTSAARSWPPATAAEPRSPSPG